MPKLAKNKKLACAIAACLSVIGISTSRGAGLLALTCSETGVSILDSKNPNKNNPIFFESAQGLLPFPQETYTVDFANKSAIRTNPIKSDYSVISTETSIELTELAGTVDTGARSSVKIDRVTGLYLRNDWSIDASGKPLALSYARIGLCDSGVKPRF